MSFDFRKISKAIAAAVAGAAAGTGTAFIMVPQDITMPWWGYLLVGIGNAALNGLVVYWAPRNRYPDEKRPGNRWNRLNQRDSALSPGIGGSSHGA